LQKYILSEADYSYVVAERHAIALLAYASAATPVERLDISGLMATRLSEDVITFAINARRYLETEKVRPEIRHEFFHMAIEGEARFEKSLWEAVNGVIHSTYLNVMFVETPFKSTPIGRTKWASVLMFETDRRPRTAIDVYSMACTFLALNTANRTDT
jgi:hypothetical protein